MKTILLLSILILHGCANPAPAPAIAPAEPEALSRTEYTNRVENYFEYEPLKSGKASQVRIHLTDLSDGSPVEQAEVTLTVKPHSASAPIAQTVGRIGKVTGIYVADLTIPKPGAYDIDFHIKNAKLDEHLPLSNFKVE